MQKHINKNFILLSILLFLLMIFSYTPSTYAVGEICSTNASCCTPPQIIQDGGGCPSGTFWIGSETGGSCQSSSLSCGTSFNCTTGACTTVAAAPACPSGKINIGGGQCADWLKIIRYPSASTIYKIFYNQVLGRLVYTSDAACSANQVPKWNGSAWVCANADDGDWAKNGTNIYSANTGNVGIGTAAPTDKLHVVGNSTFQTSLGNMMITTPGGSGPGIIAYAPNGTRRDYRVTNGGIRLAVSTTSAAPDSYRGLSVDGPTGNVGVGTNSPTNKLHVNGGVRVQGLSCLESNGKAVVTDASGNLQCGDTDDGDWVTSGTNIYNANTGNVGIGTSPGNAKLNVSGGNVIIADGYIGTSARLFVNGSYGQTSFVAGSDMDEYFTVGSNAGVTIGVFEGFDGTTPQEGLYVYGQAKFSDHVTIGGSSKKSPSDRNLTVFGKVGVNTAAPNAALSVVGSANIGAFNTASGAQSFSTGLLSSATGSHAVAMGNFNTAKGDDTLAAGSGNQAYGLQSVAVGMNNRTGCSGGSYCSGLLGSPTNGLNNDGAWGVALGNTNIATGRGAVAVGGRNEALGYNSFATGLDNVASDDMSVALGWGTKSRAELGFSMGRLSEASGYGSVAWGHSIKTTGNWSWGIALNQWTGTVTQSNTMAIMGGRVGIGISSPGYILEVGGRMKINSSDAGIWFEDGTNDWFVGRKDSSNGAPFRWYYSGNKMELSSTGNLSLTTGGAWKPGGGSWGIYSDERLKDVKGEYTMGLDEIVQLKPVNFRYKEDNPRELPSDKDYVGFVAQDVQNVLPKAVSEEEDGYLGLDMHIINVAVVNAIKELKAENDELKARIESLEAK